MEMVIKYGLFTICMKDASIHDYDDENYNANAFLIYHVFDDAEYIGGGNEIDGLRIFEDDCKTLKAHMAVINAINDCKYANVLDIASMVIKKFSNENLFRGISIDKN